MQDYTQSAEELWKNRCIASDLLHPKPYLPNQTFEAQTKVGDFSDNFPKYVYVKESLVWRLKFSCDSLNWIKFIIDSYKEKNLDEMTIDVIFLWSKLIIKTDTLEIHL